MDREIIERIINIKRTNGNYFWLNKVKAGRGGKYSIVVCDDDNGYHEILLSKNEIITICHNLLKNPDVDTSIELVDSDYMPLTELGEVNLRDLVDNHGELLNERKTFIYAVSDYTPGMMLERNLLVNVYDSGLLEQIKEKTWIDSGDLTDYINYLNSIYGLKIGYALWAIKTWAEAFGINCRPEFYWEKVLEINANRRGTPSANPVVDLKQSNTFTPKAEYLKGDIVYYANDIIIRYMGTRIKRVGGYNTVFPYFFILNNSDNSVTITLKRIVVNDRGISYRGRLVLSSHDERYFSDDDYFVKPVQRSSYQLDDINTLRVELLINFCGSNDMCGVFLRPESVSEPIKTNTSTESSINYMELSIDALELSVRAYNCLRRAGINNVGELLNHSSNELLAIRNLRLRDYNEIMTQLDSIGVSFPQNKTGYEDEESESDIDDLFIDEEEIDDFYEDEEPEDFFGEEFEHVLDSDFDMDSITNIDQQQNDTDDNLNDDHVEEVLRENRVEILNDNDLSVYLIKNTGRVTKYAYINEISWFVSFVLEIENKSETELHLGHARITINDYETWSDSSFSNISSHKLGFYECEISQESRNNKYIRIKELKDFRSIHASITYSFYWKNLPREEKSIEISIDSFV